MTVLFFGHTRDDPLAAAIEAAAALRLSHVVLDQEHLARTHDIVIDVGPDAARGRILAPGAELDLAAVTAVYARPLALTATGDAAAQARAACFTAAFVEWLRGAPCLVVNRPEAMASNGSKPYQLQLIARARFLVPETLVTNVPEEALAFRERHGRVVYKSISGIRSIVSVLDDAALGRLELIRELPVQFQAYVEGVDVRVHVVGDRCFATSVRSDAVDYRYGDGARLDPVELEPDVAARCVALAAQLGLPLCGIDLRRRPDGEYVCFEVNPMPAYSYYSRATGQPIATALAELLAGGLQGLPSAYGAGPREPDRARRRDLATGARPSSARLRSGHHQGGQRRTR